jgi:hypothetical protein
MPADNNQFFYFISAEVIIHVIVNRLTIRYNPNVVNLLRLFVKLPANTVKKIRNEELHHSKMLYLQKKQYY